MLAGRIDAVKNASNYDNNSVQNQRVMRPQRGPEQFGASKEIILCESIIDALTFWIAGFRNVTCSYGNQGFTEELFHAFIKSGVETCWIAWDNDEKSNPLALQLAERLMAQGVKCMRIIYPGKIKDANEFAMKVKDGNGTAHGSLSMLMRNAEWLMPQDIDVTKRFVPKQAEDLRLKTEGNESQPDASARDQAPKEETQPATSASLPVTIPTSSIVDEPTKCNWGRMGPSIYTCRPIFFLLD